MYIWIRSFARYLFRLFGHGLIRYDKLQSLINNQTQLVSFQNKLQFYLRCHSLHRKFRVSLNVSQLKDFSRSEYGQDIFALLANDFAENKTFVEVGAFDGQTFSNTFLLEKVYGWRGVLVEPVPRNYSEIGKTRSARAIFGAVVPNRVDTIKILENPAPNLSLIIAGNGPFRFRGKIHTVPAFTLETILDLAAPNGMIDFLSIDIEGEEFAILESFNFTKYEIKAICVEHNHSSERTRLKELLAMNGYLAVFEEYSMNDYWFIRETQLEKSKALRKLFTQQVI